MKIQSINGQFSALGINSVKNTKFNTPYVYAPITDSVSFKSRDKQLLSASEGEAAANKLRTSTSGYRGKFGERFNDKFVYSLTSAVIQDMNDRNQQISIVAGDTREATKKYAPEIRDMFTKNGIDVLVPQLTPNFTNQISPVASPVLALATKNFNIPLSILLTASHNPWDDGGYNFLTDEGAVADDTTTRPIVENLVSITQQGDTKKYTGKAGKIIKFNPYEIYKHHLEEKGIIDFDKIKECKIDIFYEDFGGTGKYYFPKLMKDNGIEIQKVLSSKTEGPNPTKGNLANLSSEVTKSTNPLRIGLATDGDSDRFGVVDENGKFINTSDVILLCAYHLIKNKGMTEGTIIKNQATSEKIDVLANYFNQQGCDIDVEQTPVGFKYLGGKMLELEGTAKEAIITGEESGGLTVRGHIPEKDGFVALATLLELISTERKPISEILQEINDKIGGDFVSECMNYTFKDDTAKNIAVDSFNKYMTGEETQIAGINIDYERTQDINERLCEYKKGGDGIKLYLEDGSAVIVRKSGTEPLMRLYIDAASQESFDALSQELSLEAIALGGKRK